MNEFLLRRIITDEMDRETAIIEVLKARGFLIDKTEDGFYLSDNATIGDAEYLSEGFNKYQIGRVINDEDYLEKSRRNWDEFGGSYYYKALRPHSVKICIDKNASIKAAIDFFNCRGRVGHGVAYCTVEWVQYVTEVFGEKMPVECLESYVAFYVKAISACGVDTNCSCDGNHKDGGKIFVYANYPSNIWHENIWKYIVQPLFGTIPYIGKKICFDRDSQEETYLTVYYIAKYLYNNRFAIRWMKRLSVQGITKEYREYHSKEEIEQYYYEECKRVINENRDKLNKLQSN